MLRFFDLIEKKKIVGYSFYLLSAFLFIHARIGASFADDSIEIINDFNSKGWQGFLHSYDFSSLYYFHDFAGIAFFKILGNSNLLWFMLFIVIHALNSFLFYLFFSQILKDFHIPKHQIIAFFSSISFLFNAYADENLCWIATYHYLFSVQFISYGLYYLARKKGDLSLFEKSTLVFFFALFCTMHEISFFAPLAFSLVIFFYSLLEKSIIASFRKGILFYLPYALTSFVILYLTKVIKGSFIPHYGVSHFQNRSLYSFLYTFYQYAIKHLFFIHNFDFSIREKLYDVDVRTWGFFILFVIIISILFFWKIRLERAKTILYAFLCSLLILFYLPISNMYFYWHFPTQNDRLSYFFIPFFFCITHLVIFEYFNKWSIVVSIIIVLSNLIFLNINIEKIQTSIDFTENRVATSYQKYCDKRPIILNMPTNYNGFYSFRDKWRFGSYMRYRYGKDISYQYVLSMPFINLDDSINSKFIKDSIIQINLVSKGGWLMKESFGGTDYEDSLIRVDYNDDNQQATVYLKTYRTENPILYCTGNRGFVELKK